MSKRIVIVTGASQGLGRSIADRFVQSGDVVVGFDIADDDTAGFPIVRTDVTDEGSVNSAFAQVADAHGNADVVVNAAGVYPRTTIDEFSVDRYRLIFDVNVLGTWLVSRAFALAGDRTTEGVLINISSIDGIVPEPRSLLYSASKAAVINLTRGLAGNLAERKIRTVSIAPNYIATEQLRALQPNLPANATTPEEVAQTVWNFTQPGALSLVTGQTFVTENSGGL